MSYISEHGESGRFKAAAGERAGVCAGAGALAGVPVGSLRAGGGSKLRGPWRRPRTGGGSVAVESQRSCKHGSGGTLQLCIRFPLDYIMNYPCSVTGQRAKLWPRTFMEQFCGFIKIWMSMTNTKAMPNPITTIIRFTMT